MALRLASITIFTAVFAAPPDPMLDIEAFVEQTTDAEPFAEHATDLEQSLPLASPEPVPRRSTDTQPVTALALDRANKLLVSPLSSSMKRRALAHAGHAACSDDCPNHPLFGSVIDDGFCDDGAPSTTYCANPTGSCHSANSGFCDYGHDCTDCGPRILPDASSICKCCAVLFHGPPGSCCKKVPLWELDGWSCPDCNEDLPKEVLCDRVVFNFRSISNLDTQTNEVYKANGRPNRQETAAGRLLAGGGRRVGYYIDEVCNTLSATRSDRTCHSLEEALDPEASPLPFLGQDLVKYDYDPEKIVFQVGIPPPPRLKRRGACFYLLICSVKGFICAAKRQKQHQPGLTGQCEH